MYILLSIPLSLPWCKGSVIESSPLPLLQPSFTVNNALTSRCQVFVLHKLEVADVLGILRRAILIKGRETPSVAYEIEDDALEILVGISDGDGKQHVRPPATFSFFFFLFFFDLNWLLS